MKSFKTKQQLRGYIASLKKEYTNTVFRNLSECILDRLEATEWFRQAHCIAAYHSIPGEVYTAGFIDKWHLQKQWLLPVVEGADLRLLPYRGSGQMKAGAFGILEPDATIDPVPDSRIDLIIVPGIAFDRSFNRLGRGKGYYDRLLSTLTVPKIGICFDFQLFDSIPAEPFDKKMDMIITEKEVIYL